MSLSVLTCVWSGFAPFGFGLPETSPEERFSPASQVLRGSRGWCRAPSVLLQLSKKCSLESCSSAGTDLLDSKSLGAPWLLSSTEVPNGYAEVPVSLSRPGHTATVPRSSPSSTNMSLASYTSLVVRALAVWLAAGRAANIRRGRTL